ncbi:unnamed protein product [Cylindrotheca closterium]|uniref:Orc1-like AAA ATPase domain-containing protein n=1 Tax=Cylindrotheca closterium TaxID=2856 RepID=A0AAD2PU33_9STRA|nr:unnamed protein product [Cylindrotheca closterium]
MLSEESIIVQDDFMRIKEHHISAVPGTPSTTASTPQTNLRYLHHSGSMSNMPKIKSLLSSDDDSSETSELEVSRRSGPGSIRMRKRVKFQELIKIKMVEKPDPLVVQKQRKRKEELAAIDNKLKMDAIGVVGRQEESKTLKECLERMVTAKRSFDKAMKFDSGFLKIPSKELVLIRGNGGVGKTTVARKLRSFVARSKGGLFVEGKFDVDSKVPFVAIANMFRKVCREILSMCEQSASHIGDILYTELGDQRDILLCLVPELAEILGDHIDSDDEDSGSGTETFDAEHVQQRSKYAFRVLSRALSAVVSPLVLLIDDIQWADMASMDFVNHLICDEQNPNPFMIIGCYRSNNNDEMLPPNSPLMERIQSMTESQDNFRYNLTEISLKNCTFDNVQEMLMAMMSIDDKDKVEGLAEICFKRTKGNPYFVIEFMETLTHEWLLKFNLVSWKWTWNEKEIEKRTFSTGRLVDMLQSRIQHLSVPAKTFLQCAACLGSFFQKSIMTVIWNEYYNGSEAASVEDLIKTLSDQRIIEQASTGDYDDDFNNGDDDSDDSDDTFQWVHNIIQEVAQDLLLLNGSNKSVRPKVGRILLHFLDKEQLQDHLFIVADLINHGEVTAGNAIECATLNLRAARKARNIAAFQSASSYASNGILVLPRDKWTSHRELTVELCTMGAMMELALENGEAFDDYSAMVFDQKDCTEIEAMPLKVSRVCKLSTVDVEYQEAVDYGLATLKDWGTSILRTKWRLPLQARTKLSKTICMAKSAPAPEDIHDTLGTITDPELLNTMKMLSNLGNACWVSKQVFLNILVICKIVELTLKHGLNDAAAPAFASLGMLTIAVRHDVKTGSRFARLALAIQDHMNASSKAETLFIAYTYCLCHTESLESMALPFSRAYSSGLSVGRNDYAVWSLVCNRILVPWMLGKSLVSLRGYCPEVLSQAEDVSQRVQGTVVKIFWQAMINFFTSSPDGSSEPMDVRQLSQLEGKIFSAKNYKGTDVVALACVHLVQGELLLFFDVEKAGERALEHGDRFVNDAPAMFIGVMETFHRAVALYAMARKTKKRKYRKAAIGLRKRIEKMQDTGNPNVKHYDIFLNAEQAALDNRNDLAETRYRRAIVYAARTGHLHHTALFNERYAEFLNDVKDDEYEARHRKNEAIRFYREWGAFAKASELSKEL